MFQRDYILRLIEQLSGALGVILGLKREKKSLEATAVVGETLKRLFGMNPQLVRALSERDLIDLLNRDGEATAEKTLVLAALLQEEAELCGMRGLDDDSYHLNRKALNLTLLAASEGNASGLFDIRRQVDELAARLSDFELPADTKSLLWSYYGETGRYADAEDVLFRLLDEHRRSADGGGSAYRSLLEEARHFYERLLTMEDEALRSGRLPREEVADGLREIEARIAEAGEPG